MKGSALLNTAKGLLLVCFAVFVVLPLLAALFWWMNDWRYTRFSWRNQDYYAQVANACDQLLAAAEAKPYELNGERLLTLPTVLRDLNIDHIVVNTNVVMIMIGSGITSHQILWKLVGTSWSLLSFA